MDDMSAETLAPQKTEIQEQTPRGTGAVFPLGDRRPLAASRPVIETGSPRLQDALTEDQDAILKTTLYWNQTRTGKEMSEPDLLLMTTRIASLKPEQARAERMSRRALEEAMLKAQGEEAKKARDKQRSEERTQKATTTNGLREPIH